MSPLRVPAFVRDLPWADAGHAAIVSAAPALLAVLAGEPRLGWSAIAAFWACFADPGGPLTQRLRAMSWVAIVGALFCFLASATGENLWLLLPLTFICCTLASFAQLWGPAGAMIGTLVSAGFVVSTELPTHSVSASAVYAAFFIGGGAWSIITTALVWRRRPWRHATEAVAQCYTEIAEYASALVERYDTERLAGRLAKRRVGTPARQYTTDVSIAHRQTLRARIEKARLRIGEILGSRPSRMRRGQQLLALLDAAEQAFVALVAIADTLSSLNAVPRARVGAIRFDHTDSLRVIRRFAYACTVTSSLSNIRDPAQRRVLQAALARTEHAVRRAQAAARANDTAALTLQPLLDRLFSAGADAVSALLPDSAEAPDSQTASTAAPEPAMPLLRRSLQTWLQTWRLRLARDLHWRSSITRHAIRVGVAATISVALCKTLNINHGYWMSLTVVFILQPYLASTWQRTTHRIAGSIAGAVGASLVGLLLPSPLAVAIAVLPIALGTFLGRTVHYAVFTFFVTLQFVLVAEIQQPEAHEFTLAALRAMNSVYGGILALLVGMLIWPERSQERLASVLSEAVARHARYVQGVLLSTLDPEYKNDTSAKIVSSVSSVPMVPAVPAVPLLTLRRQACLSADNAQLVWQGLMRSPLHRQHGVAALGDLITELRGLTAAATVLELQPLVEGQEKDKPAAAALRQYAGGLDTALREVTLQLRRHAAAGKVANEASAEAATATSAPAQTQHWREPPAILLRPSDPRSLALQRISALSERIVAFPAQARSFLTG